MISKKFKFRVKTIQMDEISALKNISYLISEVNTVKFWYRNEQFAKDCLGLLFLNLEADGHVHIILQSRPNWINFRDSSRIGNGSEDSRSVSLRE